MRLRSIITTILLCTLTLSFAQKPKNEEETKYLEVLQGRSQKIVDELNISDAQKATEVRDIIAKQYWDVNKIHDGKDAAKKEIKDSDLPKEKQEAKIQKLDAKAQKQLDKLHAKYVKTLQANLTEEQVEGVKNGMTYSILVHTYNGFLDMLPQMTQTQKDTVYSMLVEAREHAMDAGSSKEKHAWFGKYKGRINNYLSKEGYDLNKESEAWHQRMREKGIKF